MDASERAAAAHATGRAVARVTRAAADTHQVVTEAVAVGLAPLGEPARLPLAATSWLARANFAAVESAARGAAGVVAPVLAHRTPADARPAATTPTAVPWLAALGAAFGDKLVAEGRVRALTAPMAVRADGCPVDVGDLPVPRATVVVFVHGLANHEFVWGAAHADVVEQSAATGLVVRYTTGQAIADSGAELAELLGDVLAAWPIPLERIVLVGHSMGGLVIREALATGGPWRARVTDVVTLGTPHSGAPLERWAARGLAFGSSFPAAEPILSLGDERSVAIKELGHGGVAAPLAGPRWHLVAATLRQPAGRGLAGRARSGLLGPLGDGLVTLDSAHAVPDELVGHRVTIEDASHMALLDHPQASHLLRTVLQHE